MLAAAGFLTAMAEAPRPVDLNDAITAKLKTETMPANEKALVYVAFTIDSYGQVVILEINGSDNSYLEYVRTKMLGMDLIRYGVEEGKTYYYRISFSRV